MHDDPLRLLIVEARGDVALADTLLAAAKAALEKARVTFDVVTVPGALEIPAVVAMAEEGGHRPAGVRYDGFVALGCVISGESLHYGIAVGEVARALNDLAIGRRLAIGNGVLAVENTREAMAFAEAGAGGAAARACLAVVAIKRKLLGQAR